MKVLLLTNEYPPYTYGGAGVHLEYLSRELSKLMPVEVRCFGDQLERGANPVVTGFGYDATKYAGPAHLKSVFGAMQRCVDFGAAGIDAQVVHTHTWYTALGGIIAKLNYGIPLVVTVHSLEPLRPWKREQLGGGYDFSLWVERTAMEMADAVVAVSEETKRDVMRLYHVPEERISIIYNGIDPDEFVPKDPGATLKRFGIREDQPYVLFVGRITRQKGIVHLVRAIRHMDPGYQVVLCAGAPDTPEILAEMKQAVAEVAAVREGIVWIEEMVDKPSLVELYAGADAFCCPSIYEPFGIINLEAMACETAVIASAVGGIKEVVVHGETGLLVPLNQMAESPFEPLNPEIFAKDLATAINTVMANPDLRRSMGKAGRQRALEIFSWTSIAEQTKALYERLV